MTRLPGFPGLQQFCIMNCEDCDIYVCETTACVTVDKYEPHALTPAVVLPAR